MGDKITTAYHGNCLTAYERMGKNLSSLTNLGALTDGGLPFNKVSGFPREDAEGPDIRNPSELFPQKKLRRLLFWGSSATPGWAPTVKYGAKWQWIE